MYGWNGEAYNINLQGFGVRAVSLYRSDKQTLERRD